MTIHGSLNTTQSLRSRSSITFHAIMSSSKFNVHRTSLRDMGGKSDNCFDIYRPKDQVSKRNRLIFTIESKFPKPFYALKKLAITSLLALKQVKS